MSGTFTKEALVAHEQWLARGKQGAGRFVVEGSSVGGLQLGSLKLAGARLVRVDFERSRLDFADLRGAELVACTAMQANFEHAKLDGATLERCTFSDARMILSNFADGRITGGDFRRANADRGAWNRIKIKNADLRELKFGDCVLDGAVLEGCDLRDAKLGRVTPVLRSLCSTMNTTFLRCDLRGANLEGRRLDGTRFIECKLANVQGKPLIEGSVVIERPDFSGDASLRTAAELEARWRS